MSRRKPLKVSIIGGGLAGCEAAHYLALLGVQVDLYEQRLGGFTSPAHKTSLLAELVCSNSLKNVNPDTAPGVFKLEGRTLRSLTMLAADYARVPGGGALAVDRQLFSEFIEKAIRSNPNINLIGECLETIPEGVVIIATGPLTGGRFLEELGRRVGAMLYFYDASTPLVKADTIDYDKVYRMDRYGVEDQGDYLNCPMDKDQYQAFYQALIEAPAVSLKEHEASEKAQYFSGCQPLEELARKGFRTPLFGPLKPRGLIYQGNKPYAVCQLRQDNVASSLYALVGCQTGLTYQAQRQVFRLIPGLENAEFVRYGLMHRNTYVCSPRLLTATLALREDPRIFIAGQLSGVEGYLESAFTGIVAAIGSYRHLLDRPSLALPSATVLGSLVNYIINCDPARFQPMNVNWGIVNRESVSKEEFFRLSRQRLEEWIRDNEIFG